MSPPSPQETLRADIAAGDREVAEGRLSDHDIEDILVEENLRRAERR